MTSEVLMLNKDAVVIAADSAVTTGRNPHPRYSKAANKIFDISIYGNVAVTIYSSAEIDRVPWELTLKQFRLHDAAKPQRAALNDYIGELISFLQGNQNLFPTAIRLELLETRIINSAVNVLQWVENLFPDFTNDSLQPGERNAAWSNGYTAVAGDLSGRIIQPPLTQADFQVASKHATTVEGKLAPLVAADPKFNHADVSQLTQLAIENLVKRPTDFLNSTGLVFAGYGAEEIFPSFTHIEIYGHIGETLLWKDVNKYTITHNNDAWIQPFAQSAMIDRFTDGFDSALDSIIRSGSRTSFHGIVADLQARGIAIQADVSDPIVQERHKEFMKDWKKKNWDANFHPLRRVLNSLSVSEMGHLAESLLVLEALRERVTSPSESVGGPIDVAVITKAEGLVWLKRKHYFEPDLNLRYLNRTRNP